LLSIRVLKLLLDFVRARASYGTRIWTALFLPLLIGTVAGSSPSTKFESLLLGIIVVVVYTGAIWVHKKYLD
jgi:hypothetical protein